MDWSSSWFLVWESAEDSKFQKPFLEALEYSDALNYWHENFPYFWWWTDVVVSHSKVIKSKETTSLSVIIKRSNLPDFQWFKSTKWFIKSLKVSTRSCFAQSWVHIFDHPIRFMNSDNISSLDNWDDIHLEIYVTNRWCADIFIWEWEWFFRFYWINRVKNTLRWKQLYDLIKSEEFYIKWEYWKDWQLMDIDWNLLWEKKFHNAERLILPLTWNSYLPFTNGVVQVSSKRDLVKVLTPFSELPLWIEDSMFEIWETSYVRLPKNIVWVIEEWTYQFWSRHISSPLIDPWFEWPIRTEIIWAQNKRNQFIELMILKE